MFEFDAGDPGVTLEDWLGQASDHVQLAVDIKMLGLSFHPALGHLLKLDSDVIPIA